jgi:hypothetical protein
MAKKPKTKATTGAQGCSVAVPACKYRANQKKTRADCIIPEEKSKRPIDSAADSWLSCLHCQFALA